MSGVEEVVGCLVAGGGGAALAGSILDGALKAITASLNVSDTVLTAMTDAQKTIMLLAGSMQKLALSAFSAAKKVFQFAYSKVKDCVQLGSEIEALIADLTFTISGLSALSRDIIFSVINAADAEFHPVKDEKVSVITDDVLKVEHIFLMGLMIRIVKYVESIQSSLLPVKLMNMEAVRDWLATHNTILRRDGKEFSEHVGIWRTNYRGNAKDTRERLRDRDESAAEEDEGEDSDSYVSRLHLKRAMEKILELYSPAVPQQDSAATSDTTVAPGSATPSATPSAAEGRAQQGGGTAELDLSGIRLVDGLPFETTFVAEKLKVLRLRDCGLYHIPDFIKEFEFLEVLDLRDNCLEAIPESLKSIEGLKVLYLSGNSIPDPEELEKSAYAFLKEDLYIGFGGRVLPVSEWKTLGKSPQTEPAGADATSPVSETQDAESESSPKSKEKEMTRSAVVSKKPTLCVNLSYETVVDWNLWRGRYTWTLKVKKTGTCCNGSGEKYTVQKGHGSRVEVRGWLSDSSTSHVFYLRGTRSVSDDKSDDKWMISKTFAGRFLKKPPPLTLYVRAKIGDKKFCSSGRFVVPRAKMMRSSAGELSLWQE